MKYLKVWTDFENVLAPLQEDEIGRLFLAMLHYAGTGEEPGEFCGNEAFLWAVAKRDIDTMHEKDEKLRQNGSKGGIAKSKNKQSLANCGKVYQSLATESIATEDVANVSLKEIKRNEIKRNEITTFMADDDATEIQHEHNRILTAAEDAGFQRTNSVRAKLIDLYSTYGLEKMLNGFNECVTHGVSNIAYLEAVLQGKPKAAKKTVGAQQYTQRDYTGEQASIVSAHEAAMAEFLGSETG